ncbi:zinc ribbon domain-containing protein [Sphingomonas canadensis]|uniref:Zinc ribbon domain-containing protein n=1 Tax=Sphingomonas canadensis TaxID=1219257 RepID=A0ABW3HA43_9SPHN|nr:zinc ribbon domain-containing protein [Sphingomonas canadensis]MCW3836016.1 zinc ribbon domain-containing protein [Sphingomonas canadensis]
MDAIEPGFRPCPRCREPIREGATICRFCGHDMTPRNFWDRVVNGTAPQGGQSVEMRYVSGCGKSVLVIALILAFAPAISQCEQEQREQPPPEEAAKKAEDRRNGMHCLSHWDGSNADLVRQIKAALGDPDSFDHADTLISPLNEAGNHLLRMDFRAANAFGGKQKLTAWARIDPKSCKADIISVKGPDGMSAIDGL